MKKIYTLISLLAIAATPAFAQRETSSVTEDFNSTSVNNPGHQYELYESNMPDGWFLAGLVTTKHSRISCPTYNSAAPYDRIEEGNTVLYYYNVNGMTASWDDMANLSFIVTKANAGKVSFNVMATKRTYASNDPKLAFVTLWRMEKNEDGTFTPSGEPVLNYPTLEEAGVTSDKWTTLDFDIPEEMYIGLSAARVFVDDYVNESVRDTYTVTGHITNPWRQKVNSASIILERDGVPMGEAVTDDEGHYTLSFSETIYPIPGENGPMLLADDTDYRIHISTPWGYDEKRNVPVVFDNYAAEVNVELGQGTMTGIDDLSAGEQVLLRGGRLYIKGHAEVFSTDGRCLRKVNTPVLTEISGLAAGIYIINGKKVIIGK